MAVAGFFEFEEGTVPATPATSKWRLFFKTDGLYVVDDAGTETNIAVPTSFDVTSVQTDQLILDDGSELTIASGAITVTTARHTVDTEGDASSDDLDTISGTVAGEIFILSANNTARTVVLKNGTDNIICSSGGDITLDETYKAVLCVSDGTNVTAYPLQSSGVGGSTGATDNAILRADGTGGSTAQSSGLTINDSDVLEMGDNQIERAELKDTAETLTTANTGASYTIDLENGNVFELTLTGNVTYTFSNPPASGKAGAFTLIQKQDGTGSRTVTFPASVVWSGGSAPTPTATADSVDIFTFLTTDGGTTWYGFVGGQDFS